MDLCGQALIGLLVIWPFWTYVLWSMDWIFSLFVTLLGGLIGCIYLSRPSRCSALVQGSLTHVVRYWALRFHMFANPNRRCDQIRPKKYDSQTPEDMGLLPSVDEIRLEHPKAGPMALNHEDQVTFVGTNNDGGILKIKVGLRANHRAQAWLAWRRSSKDEVFQSLSDANMYNVEESTPNSYRAGGIYLIVLEPFRRWRIVYNAMVKDESGHIFHCKLNAIWSALDRPLEMGWAQFPDSSAQVGASLKLDSLEEFWKLTDQLKFGCDQYGSFRGVISMWDAMSGAETLETEFRLQGLKTSSFYDLTHTPEEGVVLLGFSEMGFGLKIDIKSVLGESFAMGHTLIPGTKVEYLDKIDSTSIDLKDTLLNWTEGTLCPQSGFIRFKANGTWSNVSVTRSGKAIVCSNSHHLVPVDVTYNCSRGRGCLIIQHKSGDTIQPKTPSIPRLGLNLAPTPVKIPPLTPLKSQLSCRSELTGGKGSSLALMIQCEDLSSPHLQIPDGLCVTTQAWQEQLIANPAWQEAIRDIQQLSISGECDTIEESHGLIKKCNDLNTLIQSGHVVSALALEIQRSLGDIFGPDWKESKRFAVRSSAVGEDSEESSAAGQNDTILGCRGVEAIEKALLQCWGSLFTFQSLQYRRQNGQAADCAMAIVIQEMVDAHTAGVMFSRDPSTGNPGLIVVTTNFGLGESVVSSLSEPDTVQIRYEPWKAQDCFAIDKIFIGSKKKKIVMTNSGETCEQDVNAEDCGQLSLEQDVLLRLGALAIELEARFGGPRDVEFAVCGKTIYLLQSRPITSLLTWTNDELLYELDTSSNGQVDVWTRANVGEVLPDAISALSNSIGIKCLDLAIQTVRGTLPASQFSFTPQVIRTCPIAQHHLFFNYLDGCLPIITEGKKNSAQKALDISMFGHDITTQEYVDMAIERRGIASNWNQLRNMISVSKLLLENIGWQKFPNHRSMIQSPTPLSFNEEANAQEAFAAFKPVLMAFPKVVEIHSIVSQASSIFQMILFLTLTENSADDWSTDTFSDATSLLVADEMEVESAGVPKGLQALSKVIGQCSDVKDFVQIQDSDQAEQWLTSNPDANVRQMYGDFLARFHSRCLKELELDVRPWGEDRTPLIKTLQGMSEQIVDAQSNPNVQPTEPQGIDYKLDNLSRTLPSGVRRALKIIVPLANGAQALREKTKSILVDYTHEIRKASRHLARAMKRDGILLDERLIFHLTLYEIQQLIQTRSPELIHKCVRRQKLFPTWNTLRFKEMNMGPPQPIISSSTLPKVMVGSKIHGTPACRGHYQGRARVIVNLVDARLIQKGDILVTVSTDIGWSPYFPLLGGVVTELGGLISHGAVVAREYGLPCVVGAEGATNQFESGDWIEIDGKAGTVAKLKNNLDE